MTPSTLLRRRAIGFVFQAFHVLPYLSVEQNVALPLDLAGRRRTAARRARPRHAARGGNRCAGAASCARTLRRRNSARGDRSRPGAPAAPGAGGRADWKSRHGAARRRYFPCCARKSKRTPVRAFSSRIQEWPRTPPIASWCSMRTGCTPWNRHGERERLVQTVAGTAAGPTA